MQRGAEPWFSPSFCFCRQAKASVGCRTIARDGFTLSQVDSIYGNKCFGRLRLRVKSLFLFLLQWNNDSRGNTNHDPSVKHQGVPKMVLLPDKQAQLVTVV